MCIQLAAGADSALDALSDTLKDMKPAPQPEPVPTKDVVQVESIGGKSLVSVSGCSITSGVLICVVVAGKKGC